MDQDDFNVGNLIGLLRRQLRLIVVCLLVVVGLTAIVVFTLTPIYEATAQVLFDVRAKDLLDPNVGANAPGSDMTRLQTELEIMRSDAVLLKVIEHENLVSDEEFGAKLGMVDRVLAFLQVAQPTLPTGETALLRVLEGLKKASSASQIGVSNLIGMSVRSESPQRAAQIANTWSSAYIEMQVTAKIDSAISARNVIQARLATSRTALVAAEESLDEYIDDNLSAIVGETGRADIADVSSSLSQLISQRNLESKQADEAAQSLAQRNWQMLTETLQSDAIRELERQREEVSQTLASAAEGPAINLRAELKQIENRLTELAGTEVANLRKSVTESQSREADLRQRLRTAVLASPLPANMLGDIFELQQSAELSRQQYQALLARTQDLDAQASLQVADSRVISPALPPDERAFPNIPLSLSAAAVLALMLGAALAFLRENLIGGLLTEDQTEAVLGVPVAVAVPRLRGSESAEGSLADTMISSPLSQLPEAIRRIRVTIDQVMKRLGPSMGQPTAQGAIVLMVTSSTADEGKSTIALSLARAYGAARKDVCLIDCDLRRPSIQEMAGLPLSDRFLRYLMEPQVPADFAGIATPDSVPGVAIVATGGPVDMPTDHLIGGPNFAALIKHARSRFDVVVLDTPPVGPVADSLYVAGHADLILFVVMSGRTSQTEARMALAHLRAARSPDALTLAVLNGQERASAHYRGSYGNVYYQGAR